MGSSSVLLVDTEDTILDAIRQTIESAGWAIVHRRSAAEALRSAKDDAPGLVLLNADITKGWHLCSQLKKLHKRTPIVLLSSRADQDVFNNHQKLQTRADAYLRFPDDLANLEITLPYYMSHAEDDSLYEDSDDAEDSSVAALNAQVVSGKREISALRAQLAETDDRRQSQESELTRLRAHQVARADAATDGLNDVGQLRDELIALKAEMAVLRPREAEAKRLRDTVEAAQKQLATREAELQELETAVESLENENQGLRASVAGAGDEHAAEAERVRTAEAALAAAQEALKRSETALSAAKRDAHKAAESAKTSEASWKGANARAEKAMAALMAKKNQLDALQFERDELAKALDASRQMMKELGQGTAQRNAAIEQLKAEVAGVKSDAGEKTQSAMSMAHALQIDLETAQTDLAATQQALEASRAQIRQLNETLEAVTSEASQRAAEVQTLSAESEAVAEERDALRQQVDALREAAAAAEAATQEAAARAADEAASWETERETLIQHNNEAIAALQAAKAEAATELGSVKEAAAMELASVKTETAKELALAKETAADDLASVKAETASELTALKEAAANELASVKETTANDLAALQQAHDQQQRLAEALLADLDETRQGRDDAEREALSAMEQVEALETIERAGSAVSKLATSHAAQMQAQLDKATARSAFFEAKMADLTAAYGTLVEDLARITAAATASPITLDDAPPAAIVPASPDFERLMAAAKAANADAALDADTVDRGDDDDRGEAEREPSDAPSEPPQPTFS